MKEVVAYVAASHGYSQRRACSLTKQHRSTQRKPSRRNPRREIRQRMREIAATRVRYGYRRINVLLRPKGLALGRNLVWRALPGGGVGSTRQAAASAQDGGAA
jgi:putative transposase